ncbi:VOC family protein [Herbaspirillum sp. DW155]|uniref:VOC family protein n=1 Tax=Herbaspirillum sp. DW155 TaxID=3095609 RepID=UPI0030926A28|nr:VOC family protein [Herbaspirillum sp. DW155]
MTTIALHTAPDHLVITAATLEAGMAWVEQSLGVSMAPRIGGQHARLGTHNALLSLGEGFYLEVIAIDPEAAIPARPRWFGMDQLTASAAPRLAHWVARTSDIAAAVAASPIAPGRIEPMSRGTLDWLITIAPDGALACEGVMPSLIQWLSQPHPASALPERGCRLQQLILTHPDMHKLRAAWQAIGLNDERIVLLEGKEAHLRAVVSTPQGERVLG